MINVQRGCIRLGFAALLTMLTTAPGSAIGADTTLRSGFAAPPPAARPRVWWHWMNGNVDPKGAELDIAWMRRVGIGGFHAFSGGLPGPTVVETRAPFMSDRWQATLRRSIELAAAAGMEVGIAGSPGWSETGGPWVSPEDGMKKYVWSELQVQGGKPLSVLLPDPPAVAGPFQGLRRPGSSLQLYRDAHVVAFPTPIAEQNTPVALLSSNDASVDVSGLTNEAIRKPVKLPVGPDGVAWIEVRYQAASATSAITLDLPEGGDVTILAGQERGQLRQLTHGLAEPGEILRPAVPQTFAFRRTVARVVRVMVRPVAGKSRQVSDSLPIPPAPAGFVTVAGIRVASGSRVNRFETKAGFEPSLGDGELATPAASTDAEIDRNRVVDLTERLRSDGRLDWTPPPGRWTILRFGWSPTGQVNGPAEPEATGLEVDKLDAAAVRRYMATYLGKYAQATGGRLGGGGIDTLLTDSWEAGVQNWSPVLVAEFRRRRGYDPLPFLPVLAGRVVTSADVSDRFLWDFRQTLKDVVADSHQGVVAQAVHQRGMSYYTEVQGDNPRAIADGMTLKARSDIPTAEYWYRPFAAGPGQLSLKADLEEAASAAHVYGKPLVAAEALTVAAPGDPWAFSPAMLKPVADEIFARGVNRFLVHDSHHQPLVDAKPGLMMLMFGQFFSRNDTWAEDAGPWVDYLSRTSFLLQQGRYVADVAYFYGEERNLTELFRHRLNTDVPDGHRYDYINPEALLTRLRVKDGRLTTPGGMEYRLLFVPPTVTRMTLPVIVQMRALVEAGAVLVAGRPVGGLGLASPDAAVARAADALWGKSPLRREGRRLGRGHVYAALPDAFAGEHIPADARLDGRTAPDAVLWLHRRTPDADIYFLSNQSKERQTLDARFRVVGRTPELWRAETGRTEPLGYRAGKEATAVPLVLEPREAAFVVFDRPAAKEGLTVGHAEHPLLGIDGPWSVTFEPGRGGPAGTVPFDRLTSWAASADPRIRYFSGSGTYTHTVTLPAGAGRAGRRLVLDLGDVRELAAVAVNGRSVGTAWHSPYRIDVTDALRPGENFISVRVVNLWPNRLIGDKQPGAVPIAFAPQSPYRAGSPLLPSGLLGPVRLLAIDETVHAEHPTTGSIADAHD